MAETDWHRHSIRISYGELDNVANMDAVDTYRDLSFGSDAELGIAFCTVLEPSLDLEIGLYQIESEGIRLNRIGSGNEQNYINTAVDTKRLFITLRRRFRDKHKLFVPWVSGGIHGGVLQTEEQEFIGAPMGAIGQRLLTKRSSIYGVHAGAGVDLYPLEESALALVFESRYNLSYVSSPFSGDINSLAFLFGLKWDFGTTTF
ncbi:hypothetical protein BVX97_01605 [bacterium E08(2017)]|nr:hypothetical protein BVX97_01605 [bacterium E08(2017)]